MSFDGVLIWCECGRLNLDMWKDYYNYHISLSSKSS